MIGLSAAGTVDVEVKDNNKGFGLRVQLWLTLTIYATDQHQSFLTVLTFEVMEREATFWCDRP